MEYQVIGRTTYGLQGALLLLQHDDGNEFLRLRIDIDDLEAADRLGRLFCLLADKFKQNLDQQSEIRQLRARIIELEIVGPNSGSEISGPDYRSQNPGPESWSAKYGRMGAVPCQGTPGGGYDADQL